MGCSCNGNCHVGWLRADMAYQVDGVTSPSNVDSVASPSTVDGVAAGAVGPPTLVDSYALTNRDNGMELKSGSYIYFGNTYIGNGKSITSIKVMIIASTGASGNMTADIWALTGTPGTDGKPTSTTLGTSTPIDANTLTPNVWGTVEFTFSSSVPNASTDYCFSIHYEGATAINVGFYGAPVSGRNRCLSTDGTSWSAYDQQVVVFEIYGQ